MSQTYRIEKIKKDCEFLGRFELAELRNHLNEVITEMIELGID